MKNLKEFQRRIITEEKSLDYMKEFIQEKNKLSQKRMKNFIEMEKFFILPKHKRIPNFIQDHPLNTEKKKSYNENFNNEHNRVL